MSLDTDVFDNYEDDEEEFEDEEEDDDDLIDFQTEDRSHDWISKVLNKLL